MKSSRFGIKAHRTSILLSRQLTLMGTVTISSSYVGSPKAVNAVHRVSIGVIRALVMNPSTSGRGIQGV